jgi:hypothetical protein
MGAENPKRHNFEYNFLGHPEMATIDQQMMELIGPGKAPPFYGSYEEPVRYLAEKNRVDPRAFQDVAWAGGKNLKEPKFKPHPMIDVVNQAIERTHRLTGKSREEILERGIIKGEIPVYEEGGEVDLPEYGPGGKVAKALAKGAMDALPMDEASRLGRAEEMGFKPHPFYHGTAAPEGIEAFDQRRGGAATGTQSARQGVWTSPDPDVASHYAATASSLDGAGGPQLVPLRGRWDRIGRIDLEGSESDGMVAETLRDSWENGFDAVVLRSQDGRESVVFKDPAQLRSPFAKFDPKKRDSADLLAGVIPGAVGAGALTMEAFGED